MCLNAPNACVAQNIINLDYLNPSYHLQPHHHLISNYLHHPQWPHPQPPCQPQTKG